MHFLKWLKLPVENPAEMDRILNEFFLFNGSESNYRSERMAWFISADMKWNSQLCVVYVVLKSRGLVASHPMILCPMRPMAHLSVDLALTVHSSGGPHTLTCYVCQVGKLQLIYLKCPSMCPIWWGSWLIFLLQCINDSAPVSLFGLCTHGCETWMWKGMHGNYTRSMINSNFDLILFICKQYFQILFHVV